MNRYNAAKQSNQGKMTHKNIERVIYFGPGRNSTGLTHTISTILEMERYSPASDQPERAFQRTTTGKHYWVDPKFAQVINIRTNDPGGLEYDGLRKLATVHDTLHSIFLYVAQRASLGTEGVVERLQHDLVPSRELAPVLPEAKALDQTFMAQVIPLHQPEVLAIEPPVGISIAL